ncbi:MAG: thioredoxin-disulfide reductase [Candidatus Krumholzibacteria bacterium]|nr:thioredoxin-disulfide reductase [Candidatus Krumholzibacteria bacterium]
MADDVRKVMILGSGPAGITAAIYAARADLQPLVLEGIQPGGQLTITTEVDNYPGFENGIMGPDLMIIMKKQAARFGTEFEQVNVDRVELTNGVKTLYAGDKKYQCQALIISTGATARWLGIESEDKLKGYGVSACATCDGFFFKDKVIAVIGGGDSAVEEATFLTKFGTKVYIIHRRDELRASKVMQERAFKNEKIEMVWNAVVEEVLGVPQTGVTGLKLKNTKTGELSDLACQGVFLAIGHDPNTQIFKGALDMDENGYLLVESGSTRTTVPGVLAAGDVSDHVYRQAITAAGMGCMAALDAERYLSE